MNQSSSSRREPEREQTRGGSCDVCGRAIAAGQVCPRCELTLALESSSERPLASASGLEEAPRVFGEYELLEELGHGGMGVVYRARHRKLNRVVALKLLLLGQFSSEQAVKRFHREAQAAAGLRHPNVVGIYDVGQVDGQHYFTMECIDGRSLASVLRDGPLPPRQAALYVQAVAEAAAAAHRSGIVHRDLKPSNILIDVFDQPRITDFGLAKRLDGSSDVTLSGHILGSPNYLAPEVAAEGEHAASPGGDVFSLGAILYESLTGRPPFMAATLQETLLRVRHTDAVAPRLLDARLPRDLETICLKALEKDPARRYGSAQELADELRRYLDGRPIQARPTPRTEVAWRWCRRNPALASAYGMLAFFALVVVVGSLAALWRINQERARAEEERARAEEAARSESALGEQARARAYTSDMNIALASWQAGDLSRAQSLLRGHIPMAGRADLRGFEWRYLWRLCQEESLVTNQFAANDPAWQLASTPAHSFAAAACGQSIRLFDPLTGTELDRLSYPNPLAAPTWHAIALAPGAPNLVAAHRAQGVVVVWDVARREPVRQITVSATNITCLALSPDGRRMATADQRDNWHATIAVWDLEQPASPPPDPIWSALVSGRITAAVFSPDGRSVLAARSFGDVELQVFDAAAGCEQAVFSKVSAANIGVIACSPDGTLVACAGGEGRIAILDFATGQTRFSLHGHSEGVASLSFSLDGQRLFSAADEGTIRIWNLPDESLAGMIRVQPSSPVRAVPVLEGRAIFSTAGSSAQVWNAQRRPEAIRLEVSTSWNNVSFSPDNQLVLVTDGVGREFGGMNGAAAWDPVSGRERFHLLCPKREPLARAFSPDKKLFAMGDVDEGGIAIWETAGWKDAHGPVPPSRELTTRFEAGSLSFSPDGLLLAAAGICYYPSRPSYATNRLAFWDTRSWAELDLLPGAGAGRTPEEGAASVAFSPNGKVLAVGYRDGWVRLWDVRRQARIKDLKRHWENGFGIEVAFSPDGRWLASIDKGRSRVFVFDVTNPEQAREVYVIRPSASSTWIAIFTPDSQSLVTGSNDGQIRFWNLRTGVESLSLRHGQGPGCFLAFSHDGNRLGSIDAHGVLKVWDAAPIETIP